MLASRHGDEREGGLPRAVAKMLLDETPWEGLWGFNVEGVGKRGFPGGSGVVKAARRTGGWEPACRLRQAAAVWKARFGHRSPQGWVKTGEGARCRAGNASGQGGGERGAVAAGTLRHRPGVPDQVALLTPWALVEGCAGELLIEGVPIRRRSRP